MPIKANLKFLADVDGPLVYIPSKGGGDETEHVGNFATHEVTILNGRQHRLDTSLDVEGFKLVPQVTKPGAHPSRRPACEDSRDFVTYCSWRYDVQTYY